MIRNKLRTILGIIFICVGCFGFLPVNEVKEPEKAINAALSAAKPAVAAHHNPPVIMNQLSLKKIPFEQLPGWEDADMQQSLMAFQRSCEKFLNQDPTHPVGSQHIRLQAKDWQPACRAARAENFADEQDAKKFFEQWFYPIEISKEKKMTSGVFTGYYTPLVKGSLVRTKEYNTPIYGLPRDLSWSAKHSRYYSRTQIDNGALNNKAQVLAWINSPVERMFMEIEGAAVVKLREGKNLYLSYAGENGGRYASLAGTMIKTGVMSVHSASKPAIKGYLQRHPSMNKPILRKNQSFVFFQNINKPITLGALGMALTPGYSLAIDRQWIPLGAPLWLVTKVPQQGKKNEEDFNRLMIAQDTGGAIHGLVRGDIYWGVGKEATYLGEHMKNHGRYWLLLPKHTFDGWQYKEMFAKMQLFVKTIKHWPAVVKKSLGTIH